VTKLAIGDQQRLNGLVDAELAKGCNWVGTAVYGELDQLAKHSQTRGDRQFADRVLKLLTIERLDLYGKEREREVGSLVNLGSAQAFVSDARSHRVRVYTKNGVTFAWQHEIWWLADWEVLGRMIQTTVAQRDTLDEKSAAMRRGYALRDRFPDAKNVEEACAKLGMTVETFLASKPTGT